MEILKATLRTREYVEKRQKLDGKTLLDAPTCGSGERDREGVCKTFDGDIERLIREGIIDMDTGLAYATNPGNLQLDMSDLKLEADPLLETSGK